MARRRSSEIFSIFGQIEAAAAEVMIKAGKANKIEVDLIPPTAQFNSDGVRAQFAIAIGGNDIPEFERTIRDLRA